MFFQNSGAKQMGFWENLGTKAHQVGSCLKFVLKKQMATDLCAKAA